MTELHKYYVYASGLRNFKAKYFASRRDAEIYMHEVCSKNNISVECTENDKHYKKYSNHNGVRFYINRV